jgi:hypothetical protein
LIVTGRPSESIHAICSSVVSYICASDTDVVAAGALHSYFTLTKAIGFLATLGCCESAHDRRPAAQGEPGARAPCCPRCNQRAPLAPA